MLLAIAAFYRWLLRRSGVLPIAHQSHFARQFPQHLRKLFRRHGCEGMPVFRRDGYHHPAMHARDFQRQVVARQLLLDLRRPVGGTQRAGRAPSTLYAATATQKANNAACG